MQTWLLLLVVVHAGLLLLAHGVLPTNSLMLIQVQLEHQLQQSQHQHLGLELAPFSCEGFWLNVP